MDPSGTTCTSPNKGLQQTHPQRASWPHPQQQVLEPPRLVFYSSTTRWQHKACRFLGQGLARDTSACVQGRSLKVGRGGGGGPPLPLWD